MHTTVLGTCDECGKRDAEVSPCREVATEYWAKPIPIRTSDWLAFWKDDEPDDNGSMPFGEGATEAEAVRDLIEGYGEFVCDECRGIESQKIEPAELGVGLV